MNKGILKSLTLAILIGTVVNANAQHSPACDAGPFEISGVLKNPDGSSPCAEVLVNGCYTFSCPPDNSQGTYQLRYNALQQKPGKEISVQIFDAASLPYAVELPQNTTTHNTTLTPASGNSANFGGAFARFATGDKDPDSCLDKNPFTNDCSCPNNYLPSRIGQTYDPVHNKTVAAFFCYK